MLVCCIIFADLFITLSYWVFVVNLGSINMVLASFQYVAVHMHGTSMGYSVALNLIIYFSFVSNIKCL